MKTAKMNILDLANELNIRGVEVETYNNGLQWRLMGLGIDLYPTTGNWKWMGMKNSGSLSDLTKYLDGHSDRMELMSAVVVKAH